MHHIVSDGWSLGVLMRELGALYEAFAAGRPSPLPELPIQYADFAVWQQQWLSGEVLEKQLGYWKRQLAGAPPELSLPTDRPRPPVQTYRGAVHPVALGRELSEQLSALSRREGVTLFMTLLAGFQALLHRYTGQDDLVVGSPIAGRTRAETEELIGFFANTLVLRTDLSGQPTVRELLGRVKEATLGAYAHQDVPFEKLVEELAPVRDPSRSPLFQATFALQNAPMPELSLGEVKLRVMEVEQTTSKFDLTLSLQETPEGLRGTLEYSTDLFEAATIARMVGHYATLLAGMVGEPGKRVWELPLLTEAERRQIAVEWNDTDAEFPGDRCIHQLFEAQVARTPDTPAVIFQHEQLTYRELNGAGAPDGAAELLSATDLLVSGPYLSGQPDLRRPWVGSTNQEFHFLTDRLRHVEAGLADLPDRIEVRVTASGEVTVNGWADLDQLDTLLADDFRRRNRPA